jgi:hypothetical protein
MVVLYVRKATKNIGEASEWTPRFNALVDCPMCVIAQRTMPPLIVRRTI